VSAGQFLVPGAFLGGGIAVFAFPGLRFFLVEKWRAAHVSMRRRVAGTSSKRLGTDLQLVGVSLEEIVIWKLLGPLVGVSACGMVVVALSSLGLEVPGAWAISLSGCAIAVGFVLPDMWVKSRAKRNRMTFLFSFSSFLDLTNVLLSGGAGMETALVAAAEAGDGVAYAKIREALLRARTTHRSPWQELQRLGDLLGLEVVSEVGASIQLAGEHGARVRSSLAKRAETVRHKQSAEVEAAANAATERMGLPMVLLFLGFLILIGYPAAEQMLQGL